MHNDSPATLRNRAPIAAILAEELPDEGLILEVASGGGEHATFFAAEFPVLEWQPSDREPEATQAIRARAAGLGLKNLRVPIVLDAALAQWSVNEADAILCINMVHISPWSATTGLFEGASKVLGADAPLILYGPYIEDEVETALSNLDFDRSLKSRDPRWGIRHREEIDALAEETGFKCTRREAMPANNLLLVYRKQ